MVCENEMLLKKINKKINKCKDGNNQYENYK